MKSFKSDSQRNINRPNTKGVQETICKYHNGIENVFQIVDGQPWQSKRHNGKLRKRPVKSRK